jgi:hypothetical protein
MSKKKILNWKLLPTTSISNSNSNNFYLERVHRALPFFTINGLHSFLISMHSLLSRDILWPSGHRHLNEPAVLMQFAAFGQREFPTLHSSMSMQSCCSFMWKPGEHSQRYEPTVLTHCCWQLSEWNKKKF